jgi:biotin carboxyl carrier protein
MLTKLDVNGQEIEVDLIKKTNELVEFVYNKKTYSFKFEGHIEGKTILKSGTKLFQGKNYSGQVHLNGRVFQVEQLSGKRKSAAANKNAMTSPMPGKVFKLIAKVGDAVKSGDPILIVEAMKMEHTIKADKDGTIKKIHFKEGEQVQGGVLLAEIGG